MNITRQDIGRIVILRNGRECKIKTFNKDASYPVHIEDKGKNITFSCLTDGKAYRNETSEYDIVAFENGNKQFIKCL